MKSILLLILIFSLGCSTLPPPPEYVKWQEDSKDPSSLIGLWKYSKSCGGMTGECHKPEFGFSSIMQITKDSIFFETINNIETTLTITSYYIFRKTSTSSIEDEITINYNYHSRSYTLIDYNTLWLNSPGLDGFGDKYIRIP